MSERRLTWAITVLVGLLSSPEATAAKFSEWCPRINLGLVVNSPSSDGGPAISKDGLSLFFHSNRGGGVGSFDLYVSQRLSEDDPWGPPLNLGPIVNSPAVDTVPALSRDGHYLFFNSTRPGGLGGFDIWASYREDVHDDFAWEAPFNLGPGVNSPVAEGGASYFENDTADGDGNGSGAPLLYFGSMRSGGPGRADIYVSTLQGDGTFGNPVLVPELSSTANDQRPSIRFDGLEIFLQRDVDATAINDNDVYVATRRSVSDPWSEPVKLGTNVNTDDTRPEGPLDDVRAYIAPDRVSLYFESGPNEPFGDLDVYMSTRSRTGSCE